MKQLPKPTKCLICHVLFVVIGKPEKAKDKHIDEYWSNNKFEKRKVVLSYIQL